MKYIQEYRDPKAAAALAGAILRKASHPWTITYQGRLCGSVQSREGFHMGRGWHQADSFRLAGEGAALSRLQWIAVGLGYGIQAE